MTIQALGELTVLYPVNGAFFTYFVRFIDPAWYVISILNQDLSNQLQQGLCRWLGLCYFLAHRSSL